MYKSRWYCMFAALMVVEILSVGSVSQASITLNLTTAGSSGYINGAYYLQVPDQSSGTGVINSFERLQGSPTEQGYNTDTNKVMDNKDGTWTHSITLGAIPKVKIGGTDYRAFLLDINEVNDGSDNFLSIDEIQLFVGGAGNQSVETFTGGVLDHAGSTLVYRMDAGDTGNQVALDYNLNPGSGAGDMYLYVLDSAFTGFGALANITLYSHFGSLGTVAADNPYGLEAGDYGNYNSGDGFEEWATVDEGGGPGPRIPPNAEAPEPLSLLVWVLLIGSVGLVKARTWRGWIGAV